MNPYQKNVLCCINCGNVKLSWQLLKQLQTGCTRDFLRYATILTISFIGRAVVLRDKEMVIANAAVSHMIGWYIVSASESLGQPSSATGIVMQATLRTDIMHI